MLFNELAANTGQMHDGKNACALEIVTAGRNGIGKQPADVGIAPVCKAGRAGSDERVDLTPLQQLRNGSAGWRILHMHTRRQSDADFFWPAGSLDASTHPD